MKKHKDNQMNLITVVNKSSNPNLTHDFFVKIVGVLARQGSLHLQPLLRILIPTISYSPSGLVQDGASPFYIFDKPGQEGALGDHYRTDKGLPVGECFLEPILENGGTIAEGPNSLTVTMSHEFIEMGNDEDANLWVDADDGFEDAKEQCDACEGDSYLIDGIPVSNFLLNDWFDSAAPASSRFDYMNRLTRPFTMTPGGYRIRREITTGNVSNVFGHEMPLWKREMKVKKLRNRVRHGASRLTIP